jgi:beta-xylosidase
MITKLEFITACIAAVVLFTESPKENGVKYKIQSPDSAGVNQFLKHSSFPVRDPFIFADKTSKTYYLFVNNKPRFKLYSSKDLITWKDEGNAFESSPDFWGKSDFWAPDVYKYNDKYYLFATFSAPGLKRGTSILVADKINGPYQPLVNRAATPANWMCLDGSLYIDADNKPWIIYCHEWLEIKDGEVVAQRLSDDLKETIGEPQILFKGSEAPWTGTIAAQGVTGYVTDAPFVYKAKNGDLLMLWSSFTKTGKYAIGVARSTSGTIAGPWQQDKTPLNNDDGGHAMLFTDFSGQLNISYHAPNSVSERLAIFKADDNNGQLTITKGAH